MKFFVSIMILLAAVVVGLPAFSASKGPVSSGQPYTVLTPRGSGLDDTAQIQAALNAAGSNLPPVMLSAGQYIVCSQLTISHSGTVLRGPAPVPGDNGSSGPPLQAPAHISCPTAGSFTNGQAFILINAQVSTVMYLNITGLQGVGGAANVDCVQTLSGGNYITYNSFGDCYNAVNINAVNTGCCSSFNQDNHVEHNAMIYNGNSGIQCAISTGSGCTDNFFNFNHLDVLFLNADILCGVGCGNSQFIGNRIEDGGTGIFFTGPNGGQDAFAVVTDNYFQDIAPLLINQVFNIMFSNNQLLCSPQVSPGIEMSGSAGSVSISSVGNTISSCSANYKVDSSGVMSGPNIFIDLYNSGPVYADVTTASQLESWQASPKIGTLNITPSGTTFTPVLDGNQRNFEIDLTANSTLADFTYHTADDLATPITFKFKQDATGGRTVTYNAAYLNHPTIGTAASLCSYAQAHMTATKVIFTGVSVNNVACN